MTDFLSDCDRLDIEAERRGDVGKKRKQQWVWFVSDDNGQGLAHCTCEQVCSTVTKLMRRKCAVITIWRELHDSKEVKSWGEGEI